MNNLKTKVDDIDIGKFRTVSTDVKKLSDAVSKEVFKNTKFKVNRKGSNLEKNSWCSYFNWHKSMYKTDKQKFGEKNANVEYKN